MKNKVNIIKITGIIFFLLLCTGLQAEVGFYVSNGRLYDANGNDFVIRGVSHAHCWYTDRTSAIADIKSVGANAVRVVLSSGEHGEEWPRNEPSDVQNIVSLCKENRLIAILECHDTTGYGEKDGAVPLSTAVNYWMDLQDVLTGEEDYVLINIGNEPYGNINASAWVNDTISAIQSMRSAGFDHTIVVDAPNWGQDWEFIMRDNAQSIYNADSTGNLVLSIHMYGVYEKDATIDSYISTIRSQDLPLMIGEFGWYHSDGDPDEAAIMYRAEEYNIGYIGWSWCGNGGGVEYLDMVTNWDVNSLTADWGEVIVNGPNGLKSKSGECSIYSGISVTPPTGPDPTDPPPSAGSCVDVPVWTATDIYETAGTRVQYNCMVYENNWYSTDQNPEEYSGEFEVWTFIGMCDDCGTTPDPATPTPTPEVTPEPTGEVTAGPTDSDCTGETGDFNSDGAADIVDALLVSQWYTGLLVSPPIGYYCCDVDCSGTVDIVDALLIAQFYVSIITDWPC